MLEELVLVAEKVVLDEDDGLGAAALFDEVMVLSMPTQ